MKYVINFSNFKRFISMPTHRFVIFLSMVCLHQGNFLFSLSQGLHDNRNFICRYGQSKQSENILYQFIYTFPKSVTISVTQIVNFHDKHSGFLFYNSPYTINQDLNGYNRFSKFQYPGDILGNLYCLVEIDSYLAGLMTLCGVIPGLCGVNTCKFTTVRTMSRFNS